MFCELTFGEETFKSDVFKTENEAETSADVPQNNQFQSNVWQGKLQGQEALFRFGRLIDDEIIQLKSLEIKVCEVGMNVQAGFGLVQIDLSPLIFKEDSQRCEGWFPIYSLTEGITGELFTEI